MLNIKVLTFGSNTKYSHTISPIEFFTNSSSSSSFPPINTTINITDIISNKTNANINPIIANFFLSAFSHKDTFFIL